MKEQRNATEGSSAERSIERVSVKRMAPLDVYEESFAGPPPQQARSPVAIINDRLRGRWLWMIILGVALAATLGLAGYTFAPVRYESRGLVKVESNMPPLLQEIPETGPIVMYRPYMMTQAGMVQSERVLADAVHILAGKGYASMQRIDALPRLANAVEVTSGRESFLISVAVEHEDPKFAMDAVNAILDSYIKTADRGEEFNATLEGVHDIRLTKDAEIRAVEAQRLKFMETSQFAAKPIEEQKRMLFQHEMMVREHLAQIEQALVDISRSSTDRQQAEEAVIASFEPTDRELDEVDPELPSLRERVYALEVEVASMETRYGPLARPLREKRNDLEAARQLLTRRMDQARINWLANGAYGGTGTLEQRKEALLNRIAELEEQQRVINREEQQLRSYDRQLAKLAEDLQLIDDRVEQLRSEQSRLQEGRVSVFSKGELPTRPSTNRRFQLAAIGTLMGFGGAFGLFFMIGTLDRRAFATAQLQGPGHQFECLGVLPDMSSVRQSDTEARDLASQCVHRIRNRIEITRVPGESYVAVVSSPSQGDGKTSLALALGWSYAASGCRTLLVDCDFIGRSLSLQTDRLGEVGVKEILRTQEVNGQIVQLQDNLSVLGIGNDPAIGPETVRRGDFDQLFSELRKQFDIIVVDTGPMLSSVEALPLAGCADGIVLAFRRGRSQRRLNECIEELRRIGANYLGVVLNCANHSECMRYSSVSRVSREVESFLKDQGGERGATRQKAKPARPNTLMRALQPGNGKEGE